MKGTEGSLGLIEVLLKRTPLVVSGEPFCFVAFTEEDLQGKTEEEIEMMKMMGFASFDTTKVSVLGSRLAFLPLQGCDRQCWDVSLPK